MVFFSLLIFSCGETSSVDDASREGILIMGNSGEPKGLDPHIVSGVLESNVIRSLFEGLGRSPSIQGRNCHARGRRKMVPGEPQTTR